MSAPDTARRPFWRRPWVGPLFVLAVAQITMMSLPYLDAETAPLMPHEGFPLYHTLLLAHIALATVALLAAILQMWPRLRLRRPGVHRWLGRVYFGTTMVAGAMGLVILPYAPPVGKIGVGVVTVLWMAFTVIGVVRARQRRYAEHRKFMIYAFALVTNNIVGSTIVMVSMAVLPEDTDPNYLLEAARWVGWVFNLMVAQWWIDHTAHRPLVLPVSPRTVGVLAAGESDHRRVVPEGVGV